MLRLLVFDLDDTLYPEREYVRSGFQAVDAWLREHRGVSGFADAAWSLFEAGARGTVFDQALAQLTAPPEPDLIRALVTVYREHRPALTLHDDAAWAIDHFAKRLDLGLLSDGYLVAQRRKIDALGIGSRIRHLVLSDEIGREHWKPSTRPFEVMMERSGRAGDECAYVSDNPGKDFIGARAWGWTTIRVHRPDGIYAHVLNAEPDGAQVEIASLHDLNNALATLGVTIESRV